MKNAPLASDPWADRLSEYLDGTLDARGDVHDHEAAHALRMRRREADGVHAAEAERDERSGRPAALVEERTHVGDEVVPLVDAPRRPVAVAVAALIERQHVVIARQVGRHLVPAVRRLGAAVEEEPAELRVSGVWATAAPPATPVVVDSWGDHRIAMAMALVGLRRPGVRIAAPEVVGKSYPRFWEDLLGLLGPP